MRPFHAVDLRDVVRAQETRFGREGDPSGVVVAVGSDGSVLPLHLGADYVDAANDLRCAVDADACVPRRPDGLDVTPTVGADLLVSNTSGHWSKWGRRYGEDVWAALTPPSPGKRVPQIRGVLALLTPAQALHFAPLTVGEGRIVLRGRTMPDGRRVPLSLHDTRLRRDCAPTQVDDGTWRCTVQLPWTCQRTRVGEGQALTEAITPSASSARDLETSCQGGPIWSPRLPARGPRRFGYDPDPSFHPAVPGRAARFSETPRMADHLEGWQPQFRRLVYDQVEELGPEVFAELRIVQDP